MDNLFSRENLLLLLVIALFGHNIFLQKRIDKAIVAVKNAEYEANQASISANTAASYASDASDYARKASRYADDAASNAFGNQCWRCP